MKPLLVLGLNLGLGLVVGCGDSGSSGEPVVVNAMGAKLAAIHDGSSWKPLALDANGKATPSIEGPTLIATVCDDAASDFMNYYTVGVGPGGAGAGDDGTINMYCGETVQLAATVTIAASPSTVVFAGFSRSSGSSMRVSPGTYDIVAVDTALSPPRIEIRRGVAVTANATMTFDLATTGTPLQKIRVDVDGIAAGEVPSSRVTFYAGPRTAPTFASWEVTGSDAFVVPASLVRADDTHSVVASTTSELQGTRSATQTLSGTETSVALVLPAYITNATATFGVSPTLAWQGDERFDELYFGINSADFRELWDVMLLPSWIEAGGDPRTLTIPDPHAIPGWTPAWEFTSTIGLEWLFQGSHDEGPRSIGARRGGTL